MVSSCFRDICLQRNLKTDHDNRRQLHDFLSQRLDSLLPWSVLTMGAVQQQVSVVEGAAVLQSTNCPSV